MIKKIKSLFRKISSQFLINYLVAFILSAICLFIIFMIVGAHIGTKYKSGIYNYEQLREIVRDKGLNSLYDQYELPEGSFIEMLDDNNKVIDQYKSNKPIGYVYSWDDLDNLYADDLSVVFSLSEGRTLYIKMADDRYIMTEEYIMKVYSIMFSSILLSIFIIIILFSRISAKMVVKPIRMLAKGVDEIGKGNYNSRISFKSKNELGQLKDSINKMAETIENEISLREKSENNRKRLILDIGHDLKTPLTNIMGYSETLLSSNNLSEEDKKSLAIIVSNSKKANSLLTDLSDLSQLDYEGNVGMDRVDICEFVRELVIDYIPEFESKSIDYNIDIPEEKIYINANRLKLNRALSNIVNNAIKYVQVNPVIDIGVIRIDNSIQIHITDNGHGIPNSRSEDIFEPFFRLDTSRSTHTGGTGLGLSITKAILKVHGGNVWLDSTYTNGARFIIELPMI